MEFAKGLDGDDAGPAKGEVGSVDDGKEERVFSSGGTPYDGLRQTDGNGEGGLIPQTKLSPKKVIHVSRPLQKIGREGKRLI